MNVYLVGGAVRDEALGLPVSERDWVVVGGTPEQLLREGYRQVGRDFPVFLHPKTQEEYALARTERKLAPGYYGFACDFNPQVTLEEDLARRDLTINAMAKDSGGRIIDPYDGLRDLQAKRLRHVSAAFAEDPVRVLRVARFAARYHHLGFTLADETRALIYAMVRRGELTHLVPERVWQEWQRSLEEKNPEVFILTLRSVGALQVILPEMDALFGVPNGASEEEALRDAGLSTLARLSRAVSQSVSPVIRFSALLLELGKTKTLMSDWPRHSGYNERSERMIKALSERLRIPVEYRDLACLSARLHRDLQSLSRLKASAIVSVLERADAFRRPERFKALLTVADADVYQKKQHERWQHVLEKCLGVKAKALSEHHQGEAIKTALHAGRLACVEEQINQWVSDEK